MNDILCSILIPVYNGEKFLEKTLQSCIEQTIADKVEIIAIDDCSSDHSFEILQKIASLHPNVIVKKNEENMGIIKTVNKAAYMTKGKYLMFLGHDDMLRSNHIETMLKEFDEDTSLIHCNADLIDKDDDIFGIGVDDNKQIRKTKKIKYYLALGNVIHSTGAIVQKKYFTKVGGWDESYRNYGEWLLWIKLASVGKVKYSTRVKALYRRHETNITNSFEDKNIKPELLRFYEFCQQTAIRNIDNFWTRKFLELKQYLKLKVKRLFYVNK